MDTIDVHQSSSDVLRAFDNMHHVKINDINDDEMSCASEEVLCNLLELKIAVTEDVQFDLDVEQRVIVVSAGKVSELHQGDVLVAVDDCIIDSTNVHHVLGSLRGPGTTSLRIRILRGHDVSSPPSPDLRDSTDSDRDSGTLEEQCRGYYHTAMIAFEEKKYQYALERAKQALECCFVNNDLHADCHLLIANCCEVTGDDNTSVKHLKCAVAMLRSSYDDYHVKLLPGLEQLFRIYAHHNKSSIAEKYGRWMITLLNRNSLEHSLLMANALSHIATLSWITQNFEKAIQTQTEALRMRISLQSKKHKDIAMALHMLASIRYDMGDMSCQTEDMYVKALQLLSSAENYNVVDYATVLGSMASFYNRKGQYMHALKLKRQQTRLYEQYDATSYSAAKAQWGLAGLLHAAGVNHDAAVYREKAISVLSKLYGATHSRVLRYVAEDEKIRGRI